MQMAGRLTAYRTVWKQGGELGVRAVKSDCHPNFALGRQHLLHLTRPARRPANSTTMYLRQETFQVRRYHFQTRS